MSATRGVPGALFCSERISLLEKQILSLGIISAFTEPSAPFIKGLRPLKVAIIVLYCSAGLRPAGPNGPFS